MKSAKADGAKEAANQQFPKQNTGSTGGYENAAHELKEIRYQSRTYMEPETEADLKSRMRENRTYGSVRGIRQAFHISNS